MLEDLRQQALKGEYLMDSHERRRDMLLRNEAVGNNESEEGAEEYSQNNISQGLSSLKKTMKSTNVEEEFIREYRDEED